MQLAKAITVGRTGDGKSAVCNRIARSLGCGAPSFLESADPTSFTAQPVAQTVAGVKIIDTPGLLDTGGVSQDEANIQKIVEMVRQEGFVNALLLVVNEECPRFDDGMQNAVKLIVDSFGENSVHRLGIVFTKASGKRSRKQAKQRAQEIGRLMEDRLGYAVPGLPCWQVECHPEELSALRVPSEVIAAQHEATENALQGMIRWVRSNSSFDTSAAKAAEYDQRRVVREALQAAQEAQQQVGHQSLTALMANATYELESRIRDWQILTSKFDRVVQHVQK